MVKVTVNIDDKDFKDLETIANLYNISMTTALGMCITNQKFYSQQMSLGNKVLIEYPNGKMNRVSYSK